MAVGTKSNEKTKMTLRQEIANDTYANQTLSNLNPSLTLDKFASIGASIGTNMTQYAISSLIRTDTYEVATE